MCVWVGGGGIYVCGCGCGRVDVFSLIFFLPRFVKLLESDAPQFACIQHLHRFTVAAGEADTALVTEPVFCTLQVISTITYIFIQLSPEQVYACTPLAFFPDV